MDGSDDYRSLLNYGSHEEIAKQARAEGIPENEIRIRQSDCWHHLRNTWIGNTVKALSEHLNGALSEDLEKIPTIYRVSTEISALMIATEKYFGIQANYIKGKGSMFLWWLRTYHPGVYLYATMRACGGTRQDGDTEQGTRPEPEPPSRNTGSPRVRAHQHEPADFGKPPSGTCGPSLTSPSTHPTRAQQTQAACTHTCASACLYGASPASRKGDASR